ncbi:MAG: diguanylate cyclase [Thioalkalivibrio sp.]
MTQDLHNENRELRRQLRELLSEARENERKLDRFQALELRLVAATGLAEIVTLLSKALPRASRLDHMGLLLSDISGEIGLELAGAGIIPVPGQLELNPPVRLPTGVYLGPYEPQRHGRYCAGRTDLASVAMLPLRRSAEMQSEPLGTLVFGSRDPGRYGLGVDSFFLERTAAITAVCIENALNLRRLRELGLTDPLTGLRNRRYFDEQLPMECQRARRGQGPLACLFVDIDRFKSINDVHGHPAGDQAIREVAKRISAHVRPFDLLARYGGEEFVILLARLDAAATREVAERVRQAVAQRPVSLADGPELELSVSLGGAVCARWGSREEPEQTGRRLMEAADLALLEAKQSGRNRVVMAAPRTGLFGRIGG